MEGPAMWSRRQSFKVLGAAALAPAGFAAASSARAAAEARLAEKRAVRLIVLDVGGTIIPDHGEVPTAMQSALGHGGVTVSLDEIGEWRGASKRGMVRHFVELRSKAGTDRAAVTEAIYRDFSAQVTKAYADVQPIAGAEDAFRAMRGKSLLLATTTGFDRDLTTKVFRRLKWQDYFVASITSDDVVDGRPSPFMLFHAMEAAHVDRVSEVVAVGDTPLDLQAGSNAGLRGVIGVLSGAGTPERLAREPHTHILPSVAELPDLLASTF
jgi:phosphonatase-like hydrolase